MNVKKTWRWSLLVLAATPFVMTSCSESEDSLDAPQVVWNLPSDTTVAQGKGFDLTPVVVADGSTTCQWFLNGRPLPEQASYHFDAADPGVYEIEFHATNAAGSVQKKMRIKVRPFYNGFFVINEGQFGKATASFNYYSEQKWAYPDFAAFKQHHADLTLGNTGTTGCVLNDNLYITAKDAPLLTQVDLLTMKQKGALMSRDLIDGGQASAFCPVDEHRGVLTSTRGAYEVNLDNMSIVRCLTSKKCTDVQVSGDYLYMLVKDSVTVYRTADLTEVAGRLARANTGFAVTQSEVWAANGEKLVKVTAEGSAAHFKATEIKLPENYSVYANTFAYTPTCLKASPDGKYLYFVQNDGFTNKKAVRYDIASQTATIHLNAPKDYSFYGAGLQMDPQGRIYLIYTEDGYGDHYLKNQMIVTDAVGVPQDTIPYHGEYWFPSMLVFE